MFEKNLLSISTCKTVNLINAEWASEILSILMAERIDYVENNHFFPNDWVRGSSHYLERSLNSLWKQLLG